MIGPAPHVIELKNLRLMKRLTALFTFFAFVLTTFNTSAQSEVEMADTMRSSGKIYVVVAILVLILVGLFLYVFLMDRKISKLEEKVDERAQHG